MPSLITKYCFVLVILLFVSAVFAQSPILKGTVTDLDTGEPLPGVNVQVKNTQKGDATDLDGMFSITGLKPSSYKLVISRIGYETVQEEADLSSGDASLNITLKEKPLELGEEVIVVGTKMERTGFDLPVAINTITSDALFEKAELDLKAEIEKTPSVQLMFNGTRKWFIVRGATENRILTVIDDDPIPSWEESRDLTFMNSGDIERIEVIKGPFAVQYGSNALSGFVNVLRKPLNPVMGDFPLQGQLEMGYESATSGITGNVGLYGTKGIFDLGVTAEYTKKDDYESPNGPVLNTDYKTMELGFKLGLRPATDHHLLLNYVLNNADDIGVPEPFDTLGSELFVFEYPYRDKQELKLRYNWSNPAAFMSDLRFGSSYIWKDQRAYQDLPTAPPGGGPPPPPPPTILFQPPPSNFHKETYTNTKFTMTNLWLEGSFIPVYNVKLLTGLRYLMNTADEEGSDTLVYEQTDSGDVTFSEGISPDPGKNVGTNLGLFLQAEYNVIDKLLLSLGGRYDSYKAIERDSLDEEDAFETSKSAISGSFGVVYHLLDWLNLSANVGRSFRFPTYSELFMDIFSGPENRYVLSNDELTPEYSLNLDFNIKGNLDFLTWTLSFYDNEITDRIYWIPIAADADPATTDTIMYENTEKVRMYGFEFSTWAELPYDIELWGNFSKVYGTDLSGDESDDITDEFPPASVVFGAKKYLFDKRIWAGIAMHYVGERIEPITEVTFEPYSLLNAFAGGRIYGETALSFSVTNLLDEEYMNDFGGNMGQTRSFNVFLKTGF